jgi:hypothetical protein
MVDLVCIEQHPAYRHTRDENAWQAAAELVADRHFGNVSPEFMGWFNEQDYRMETAYIVSNIVVGANAESHSTWKLVRDLYEEVRKEAQC